MFSDTDNHIGSVDDSSSPNYDPITNITKKELSLVEVLRQPHTEQNLCQPMHGWSEKSILLLKWTGKSSEGGGVLNNILKSPNTRNELS